MRKLIALLLVSYAAQSSATQSYLQRFRTAAELASGKDNHIYAQNVLRKAYGLVDSYPWLAWLDQPTAEAKYENFLHRFEKRFRMKNLPFEFLSHERTELTYPNGTQVTHFKISEKTFNYMEFKQRGSDVVIPSVVTIRDSDGIVQGEYLYAERGVKHLHNLYSESGFSFEDFLRHIESPLINIAAGGFHFAYQLNRLFLDMQLRLPQEERKYTHVFNLDLSGDYPTLAINPLYLFADMYDTNLPDNTFGGVIALGGPMRKLSCSYNECVNALRELGRIAKPNGRLLIEFSFPSLRMIDLLKKSALNYVDFSIYEGSKHLYRQRVPLRLISILLGDNVSTSEQQ